MRKEKLDDLALELEQACKLIIEVAACGKPEWGKPELGNKNG